MGDRNWSDSDELVTFMVFDPTAEPPLAIVRGILMSRGIPFFLFEPTKGKPASISVPGSRLADAKRAVEEARKIGSEIEDKKLL